MSILKEITIIETEDGPFTNNPETGQTAEQVYQEWLKNKDKPIENTEENLIDKLILDNINMQIQIDSLIESQLGGN
ncbi:hypothetical protein ACQPUR_17000 [Clostridium neonatale]|uniref:hypothetical protein n=1 Tax=Clostridium neonatale TaxID=137838 RepID=UPI003D32D88A